MTPRSPSRSSHRTRFASALALVAASNILLPGSFLGTTSTVRADDKSEATRPKIAIERFVLDNGLRVVLNRDTTSPTVAVVVWYDVGSRNEKPGEGGFAHLFEHIMFEGSGGVPRGMHDKLVEGRGGRLNASTSEDWTRYWETMPSSELAVTLFLEADRMKSLAITEEAFENQRKVVQEEYRMRVGNTPYVKGYFRLMELIYEGYHAYSHPAIGSMEELDAAKLDWVKKFHKNYYGPNNAVLVISGDIETDAAKGLIQKYFGAIPKIEVPAYVDPPFVGRTKPSGPELVSDSFATTTASYLGWSIPKDGDKDHYALEMAATILSGGESSRLQSKLVRDQALLTEVGVSTEDHRGPDALVIEAKLAASTKLDHVEKLILAEVESLGKTGPTVAEMTKARAKIEHGFLFGLQANLPRALVLAKYEGQRGDATKLRGEVDAYLAVTADDVKAAVVKYLRADRLSHVRVLPAPKGEKPGDKGVGKPAKKPEVKGPR